MRMTKLPSTWYSTDPMNKPLSLVKSACFECFGRCPWLRSWKRMRCPLTPSAGNGLSVVSWVMGTANRVKGRAVVSLSADATHLLMASEISDVVGMKAVPQTPQRPRCMATSPLPSRGPNSGESSIWGMENG